MWAEIRRLINLLFGRTEFDWNTQGPPPDEEPVLTVKDVMEAKEAMSSNPWEFGWWYEARKAQAHPGRIGNAIVPRAIVVHTTDMAPGTFNALIKSWTTQRGRGNAAHFLIGRNGEVVQFAPITRNANHAGGKTHGWWKTATGQIHPNTAAVGIELDCAGRLKQRADGTPYHPDTGKAIPLADVYWDSKGRPWHKVTEPQLYTLRKLIDDLKVALKPMDAKVAPSGDYRKNGVAHYAPANNPWLVGHVTLDPVNKTDPGPQVMEWLNQVYS